MSELALCFWGTLVFNLIVIAFGSLHYRIDPKSDVFYTAVLLVGVGIMVGSGVGWVVTRGG